MEQLKVFKPAKTVGELKAQLAEVDDNIEFGFYQQPIQELRHIKIGETEFLVYFECWNFFK